MTHNFAHDPFVEKLKKQMQQEATDRAERGGPAKLKEFSWWERKSQDRLASLHKFFENNKDMVPEEGYKKEFDEMMKAFAEAVYEDRTLDAWDIFEEMRLNFGYVEFLSERPWGVKEKIFDTLLPEMERMGEGDSAALLREYAPQMPTDRRWNETDTEALEMVLEKTKLYYVLVNNGDVKKYLSYVDKNTLYNPLFIRYAKKFYMYSELRNSPNTIK